MTTDELREKYTGKIHFNCKDGDEAFTDGYVLWLEEQLLSYHEALHISNEEYKKLMKALFPNKSKKFI